MPCPSGVLPRPYLFAAHCKAPRPVHPLQSVFKPKLSRSVKFCYRRNRVQRYHLFLFYWNHLSIISTKRKKVSLNIRTFFEKLLVLEFLKLFWVPIFGSRLTGLRSEVLWCTNRTVPYTRQVRWEIFQFLSLPVWCQ